MGAEGLTFDGKPALSPRQIKALIEAENAALRAEVEALRRQLASFRIDHDRMEREWANVVLKSRGRGY